MPVWKKLRNRSIFYKPLIKGRIKIVSIPVFNVLDDDEKDSLVDSIFEMMNIVLDGCYRRFGTSEDSYEYMYKKLSYYFGLKSYGCVEYVFLKKYFIFDHQIKKF